MLKNVFTLQSFSNEEIDTILEDANKFKQGAQYRFDQPVRVANLFFEPSTRTSVSFSMAQNKLGLEVIPVDLGNSSVLKGETLYDTVRTLEVIGLDALVIRHPQEEYFNDLKNCKNVAILNGGDGKGNHPSQCMLDLLTIQEEFGRFNGLTVTIAGDIKHSRVARSNAEILTRLGANVQFTGPADWFDEKNEFGKYVSVEEAVATSDVYMLLRIQHERHNERMQWTKEEYNQLFGMTAEREKQLKPNCIIMHPAPINRDVEIDSELVECERSRIFKQMENGVYVRMALLKYSLEQRFGGSFVENTTQERYLVGL